MRRHRDHARTGFPAAPLFIHRGRSVSRIRRSLWCVTGGQRGDGSGGAGFGFASTSRDRQFDAFQRCRRAMARVAPISVAIWFFLPTQVRASSAARCCTNCGTVVRRSCRDRPESSVTPPSTLCAWPSHPRAKRCWIASALRRRSTVREKMQLPLGGHAHCLLGTAEPDPASCCHIR